MYPSGQTDPGATYIERDPSANSPSEEEDEGSDEYGSGSYTDEVSGNKEINESLLWSVVGPNGLRNFDLPLIWTINNFSSFVKSKHFNTLWDRYQIPADIPIHLPHKFEKCYYRDASDIMMYEQLFKAGLRLPLSVLHLRLL